MALSNMTNGKGIIYTNGKIEVLSAGKPITNKYIELTRSLNFKSNYSYADSSRIDFGDLNTNGTVESIKEELTKTDEGCIGFTPIGNINMIYYFDGKNNTIKNIYIHVLKSEKNESVALFRGIGDVKNLRLTGTIINEGWEAAGIACYARRIENCINYAEIIGINFVAGINSFESGVITNIDSCVNYGHIKSIRFSLVIFSSRWNKGKCKCIKK